MQLRLLLFFRSLCWFFRLCHFHHPSVPLRPRRDAPSFLLYAFSIELEARIWFAVPQRRDLRAMKTRPCAPGKINAPPRSTSQNISPAPFRLFLMRGQSFKSPNREKKAANCRAELSQVRFGHFLATKLISPRNVTDCKLLALRLQWFESTPTQASSRAILQVLKPLGG
jgi:hypothetical protein